MTDTRTPLSRRARLIALQAFMAGRRAAAEGRPVTGCPFQPDATASDSANSVTVAEAVVERFLARMWVKGWTGQTEPPPDLKDAT